MLARKAPAASEAWASFPRRLPARDQSCCCCCCCPPRAGISGRVPETPARGELEEYAQRVRGRLDTSAVAVVGSARPALSGGRPSRKRRSRPSMRSLAWQCKSVGDLGFTATPFVQRSVRGTSQLGLIDGAVARPVGLELRCRAALPQARLDMLDVYRAGRAALRGCRSRWRRRSGGLGPQRRADRGQIRA